ncbi:MAG: hypothetical protein HZA03_06105 [Nitrospinae bacterium]|nr:hypothetical protein [Nitrospinota bacterium]
MDRKGAFFFAALLRLALAVAAILLAAAILDAAAHTVIGYATASKEAAYTATHFLSPALPGWGGLLLALLLPPMAVLAGLAGEETPGMEPPPESVSAAGGVPRAGRILAGVAAMLCIAATLKAAAMEPMIADEGRVAGLARFAGGFNRALAAKARFDEKAYVREMCGALLADGPAFGRFARSWYWAYFADEGVTRDSRRAAAAVALLEPLYRGGRLTDPAAFELAKLFSENGMAQNARDVVQSLLTRHPLNADYAEFEAALAAENEK